MDEIVHSERSLSCGKAFAIRDVILSFVMLEDILRKGSLILLRKGIQVMARTVNCDVRDGKGESLHRDEDRTGFSGRVWIDKVSA